MSRSILLACLVSVAPFWACGCSTPAVAEPSPVVPPQDPRVTMFRTAVRKYLEEVRVATNRFELGMCHSAAEIVLDDLKDVCARIPDAPRPEFQPQRDHCVAMLRKLESVALELAAIDTLKRKTERGAPLAVVTVTAHEPDWVPPEERLSNSLSRVADLGEQRAEVLERGVADLRFRTEQLKDSMDLRGPLAARDRSTGATFSR